MRRRPCGAEEEGIVTMQPNLRLRSAKYGQTDGTWYVHVEKGITEYHRRVLAEYGAAEPDADWHFETCGTCAGWHRIAAA